MSFHHLTYIKIRNLIRDELDAPSNIKLDIENVAACCGQPGTARNVEEISEGDFL